MKRLRKTPRRSATLADALYPGCCRHRLENHFPVPQQPNRPQAVSARRLTRAGLLGALLIGIGLFSAPAIAPLSAQDASTGVTMRVIARVTGEGADSALIPVTTGDVLGNVHQVQIRVRVKQDAHVYVIAYSSALRSALLLHPPSGRAEDALLRSNEERIVPGSDRYLSLHGRTGPESFFAVATSNPRAEVASLLVRMEAAGDDHAGLSSLLKARFSEVLALTIHNDGGSLKPGGGQHNQTADFGDPQLDVAAMECLYAWLIGGEAGDGSISGATGEAPEAKSARATGAGCAGAVPIPLAARIDPAGGDSPPADVGARTEEKIAESLTPAEPPQTSAASVATGVVETDRFSMLPPAPLLAPPKGDLLVSLASGADTEAPVRSIDVTAEGNVSSAVVLVVTPAATGTGVLLDYAGHVLANWHIVRGYPSVSVSFKTQAGSTPSRSRTRSARVVRLSKTADLALLRIENPPPGIAPVRLAKTNEVRTGDIVHAVGHPNGGDWAYSLGKIDQVKPGSSWYAGHNLLHRGTVIFAELPDNPGGAGAPLFNNRLELVGIGAMPRSIRGVLTGVSVETIRRFLGTPPAEAQASTGG